MLILAVTCRNSWEIGYLVVSTKLIRRYETARAGLEDGTRQSFVQLVAPAGMQNACMPLQKDKYVPNLPSDARTGGLLWHSSSRSP